MPENPRSTSDAKPGKEPRTFDPEKLSPEEQLLYVLQETDSVTNGVGNVARAIESKAARQPSVVLYMKSYAREVEMEREAILKMRPRKAQFEAIRDFKSKNKVFQTMDISKPEEAVQTFVSWVSGREAKKALDEAVPTLGLLERQERVGIAIPIESWKSALGEVRSAKTAADMQKTLRKTLEGFPVEPQKVAENFQRQTADFLEAKIKFLEKKKTVLERKNTGK